MFQCFIVDLNSNSFSPTSRAIDFANSLNSSGEDMNIGGGGGGVSFVGSWIISLLSSISVSFSGSKRFGVVKVDLVSFEIFGSLDVGEWPGEDKRLLCLVCHGVAPTSSPSLVLRLRRAGLSDSLLLDFAAFKVVGRDILMFWTGMRNELMFLLVDVDFDCVDIVDAGVDNDLRSVI